MESKTKVFKNWDDVPSTTKTKTQWSREGRRLQHNAKPVGKKRIAKGFCFLYDAADTEPKKKSVKPPVLPATITPEIILAATFTVNRAAKRFRNASKSCYHFRCHGLASANKSTKDLLYDLKDKGIAWAYCNGVIEPEQIHGRLALYRGNGYCFHSTLLPRNHNTLKSDTDGHFFAEAKPRESQEIRLADAKAILGSLTIDFDTHFTRLAPPCFRKPIALDSMDSQPHDDDCGKHEDIGDYEDEGDFFGD